MLKKKREAELAAQQEEPQEPHADPQEEEEHEESDHEGQEEADGGELEFEEDQSRTKLNLPGELSKEKGSSEVIEASSAKSLLTNWTSANPRRKPLKKR